MMRKLNIMKMKVMGNTHYKTEYIKSDSLMQEKSTQILSRI